MTLRLRTIVSLLILTVGWVTAASPVASAASEQSDRPLWWLGPLPPYQTNSGSQYGIKMYADPLPVDRYKLAPLTDKAFNALPERKRYKVAVKLYDTLF